MSDKYSAAHSSRHFHPESALSRRGHPFKSHPSFYSALQRLWAVRYRHRQIWTVEKRIVWALMALWQALGHTHKLSFLRKNGRFRLHFIDLFGCALGCFQSRPAPWWSSNEQTSGSGHESCHSWSRFSLRIREQVSKWAELWCLWMRSSIALRSSRGMCNRSSKCLMCSVLQEWWRHPRCFNISCCINLSFGLRANRRVL